MEIKSPSNSDDEVHEKIRAYLAAGASEVWIVNEDGIIEYHDRGGKRDQSSFTVSIKLPKLRK